MPKGGNGGGGNGGNGGNGGDGTISGNKRDNFLSGTENAELIQGKGGNDTLEGLGGNDTLDGGTGDDSLIGGLGDDLIDGGEGTDRVVFSGNRADYSITQIDATTVEITGPDGTDTVTNVESFEFADMTLSFADLALPVYDLSLDTVSLDLGQSDTDLGGDPFTGQGYGGNLSLSYGISNNGLAGTGDATVTFYLSSDGTVSADDLVLASVSLPGITPGMTHVDTLDVVVSGDVLAGDYEVIAVVSWGNPDDDATNNSASTNVTLIGGLIPGTTGNDVLAGTDGNDVAEGDLGNDTFVASAGLDRFDGGAGTDTVDYSGFSQSIELRGGIGNEVVLVDGAPKDALFNVERFIASGYDDELRILNSGINWIDAGAGNDTVTGSSGDETLFGGAGDDLLHLISGSDSVDAGSGIDTITLAGNRADYLVTQIDADTVEIARLNSTDVSTITGVEAFQFWDITQSFGEVVVPLDPNLYALGPGGLTGTIVEGEVISAYWYVGSNGDVDAENSATELVISTAPDMAQAIESFGYSETGVLATGATGGYTATLDTTGFAPGTYYIAAVADVGNQLDESDETDNVSTWTQIVIEERRVDYSLDAITVLPSSDLNLNSDPYDPGQSAGLLDMNVTVTNNSNVGPTQFEVMVFLSTDNVISEDDFQLYTGDPYGSQPIYTVDYGQVSDLSVSAELSEGFPQGDYYVIAIVNEYDPMGGSSYGPYDNPDDNVLVSVTPISLVGGWTYGTEGNDLFTGNEFAERFEGYGGDDTLTGDLLGDVFLAGEGVDTLDLSAYSFGIHATGGPDASYGTGVEIREANVTAYYGGSGEPPVGYADSVERVIGSDFDDLLGGFNSTLTYFDGGAGNDQIVGSYADDVLIGGLGDDFLFGNLGDDTIIGGEGNDTIYAVSSDIHGAYDPNGHDVVNDFDTAMDLLLIVYDPQVETFDPFANLSQTADGALVTISPDASVLLQGIDMFDLTADNLGVYEDGATPAV